MNSIFLIKDRFYLYRYELLEPQDQDPSHRRDETPPPLPARQNYQAVTPNKGMPGQKKERESHYTTGKQFLDPARHHNHDHFGKESNYVSPRVLQESIRQESYQRLENAHRNQEHVSQSYVKLQKEKYEVKQENVYASQRELLKNEPHSHQKLAASNSLPLAQNSSYSLPKSGGNNNLIRYNEYEQTNTKYEYDNKPDRNSKYDIYEEKCAKHEDEVRHREKRSGHEYEETYERRDSKYESDFMRNEMRYDTEQHNSEGKHEDHEQSRENKRYYEAPHEFKVGEKVTCLKTTMSERPVPHKVNRNFIHKIS